MTAGPRNFEADGGDGGDTPVRAVQSAALRRARFADGGEPELSLAGALEFADAAAVDGDAVAPLLLVCALVANERVDARTEPPESAAPVGPMSFETPREGVSPAAVGAALARERYDLSLSEAAELAGLRPEAVERAAALLERS